MQLFLVAILYFQQVYPSQIPLQYLPDLTSFSLRSLQPMIYIDFSQISELFEQDRVFSKQKILGSKK